MDARRTKGSLASLVTTSPGVSDSVHQLAVDHSACDSALLDAVRRSGWFDVRMECLSLAVHLRAALSTTLHRGTKHTADERRAETT
jgi:hypothetical protein